MCKTWGIAQVIEYLSTKHKVLSSGPSTTKKKPKNSDWNLLKEPSNWAENNLKFWPHILDFTIEPCLEFSFTVFLIWR
jgi:hypothetical protein